jgi:hypothetical protein
VSVGRRVHFHGRRVHFHAEDEAADKKHGETSKADLDSAVQRAPS